MTKIFQAHVKHPCWKLLISILELTLLLLCKLSANCYLHLERKKRVYVTGFVAAEFAHFTFFKFRHRLFLT